jgi:hypothetical protein
VPSRYFREKYLTSPRINAVEPDGRDLWVRLVLVADDHGRFWGDPQLIASRCYPLKPDAANVARLLSELARVDLIELYEVEGKAYLLITQWQERIRSDSKYPAPNGIAVVAASASDLPDILPRPKPSVSDQPPARSRPQPSVNGQCAHMLTIDNVCVPPTIPIPIPGMPPTPPASASRRIKFDAHQGWTGIVEADRLAWAEAYPSVDVTRELAKARVWMVSNPGRAPRSQFARFLNGWFGRAQKDAEANGGRSNRIEERRWQ